MTLDHNESDHSRDWSIAEDRYISVFKIYVTALEQAARRSRWVLVVTATASILFFAAFWNSRSGAWFNQRIRTLELVLRTGAYEEDKYVPDPALEIGQLQFAKLRQWCMVNGITGRSGGSDTDRRAAVEHRLIKLRDLRDEKMILVSVPFFGTVFDINDLGVIAGVTCVFLLGLHWFSLTRERDTLVTAFKQAQGECNVGPPECATSQATVEGNGGDGAEGREGKPVDGADAITEEAAPENAAVEKAAKDLESAKKRAAAENHRRFESFYYMLAATQVFNVPMRDRRRPNLLQRNMARLLVLPPLMVQLLIVAHDLFTVEIGVAISAWQTGVSLLVEGVCLIAIVTLTGACVLVSGEIQEHWNGQFCGISATKPMDGSQS